MLCEVVIMLSPWWCAVQIHYNGDDGCAFILVECMKRCGVGRARTESTFELVCVWIWMCYYNDDDGFAFILVECMEHCRVGRVRTESAFVLVCAWIWMYSMQYEAVIPPWCAVQILYNCNDGCSFIFVECMKRCHACRRCTNSKYVCINACLHLKVFLVLDTVLLWGGA